MTFDAKVIWSNLGFLLLGAAATVKVSIFALALALLIGIATGIAGASRIKALQSFQQTYAYVIRGIPLLVQLFIVYFALPFIGLVLPAFTAGVIALGVNSGAYISEIVRAGIESLEREQWEAASLDGAAHWQILFHVLLPQAVRRITAGTTNELISLVKGSSLLALIAIFELTRAAQIVASAQFVPFEMYLASGLMYLLLVSVLIRLSYVFERRAFG